MLTFPQEFSLSWGYNNRLLTQDNCWIFLVCQDVSPLHLQGPPYLCFSFLINAFPSEMLCVWKVFSNHTCTASTVMVSLLPASVVRLTPESPGSTLCSTWLLSASLGHGFAWLGLGPTWMVLQDWGPAPPCPHRALVPGPHCHPPKAIPEDRTVEE